MSDLHVELRETLLKCLNDHCYGMLIQLAWGESSDILDVIWPDIEAALNTSYRLGRQEGLSGDFIAGQD